MSKRARAVAGATAISLSGFAVAGFGAWRPAAAYGSGLSPRSFTVPCDITVTDDTGLQAAVSSSRDDSVICIAQSITLSDQLVFDDTRVTLVGDDSTVTLTAAAGTRHIYAKGSSDDTLTVQDLTLTGGDSGSTGGAIYASNASVSVSGMHFSNNTADDSGGAIYTDGGLIEITNSLFSNNEAGLDGGALFGGEIHLDDSVAFMSNSAPGGQGGAIYAIGDVFAYGSTFTGNWSSGDGGAIRADAYVKVVRSTFTDNYNDYSKGGAISANAVYGSYARLIDNGDDSLGASSTEAGGAIWTDDTVTLANSTVEDNEAQNEGGAIRGTDNVTLISTSLDGNVAGTSGGAVFSNADVYVYYSDFTDNSSFSGGGAVGAASQILALHSTFRDNYTSGIGGAASAQFFSGQYLSLIGNGDDASGISVTRAGGAVHAIQQVWITNSTLFGNTARETGGSLQAENIRLSFVSSVDDSSATGSVVDDTAGPAPWILGSVISPAVGGGTACSSSADDSSYDSFVTDGSCGSGDDTVTITTHSALGFDDTLVTDDSTGAMVLIPDDTSILVNAAPADLVIGVTFDQLLSTRGRAPDDSTTVGAVQVLPVLFTTQPANASVNAGGTATFTVAALPGVGTSPVNVQWQTSTDGGTSWANAAGAGISGATTGTLTVASASSAQNGLLVRALVSDLRPNAATSATASLTVTSTPSPPAPLVPGAPRNPTAIAGDRTALVTWEPPTTPGDFPVTSYQVVNDLDTSTCLVVVTPDAPLACDVPGLANGTSYRFRVRAFSGAGWGTWSDWSDPVTPDAPPVVRSIVITGAREGRFARVIGQTSGIGAQQVTTRIRLQGQPSYRTGVSRTIDSEGTFTWQRSTGKRVFVYFIADGVRSNRVVIPSRS